MPRAPMSRTERQRRRYFFRATGRPGRPANTDLKAHLEHLAEHISLAEIARRADVHEGTVWHQINGGASTSLIPTRNALLAVRLTPGDKEGLSQEERMTGAYRIVQGLAAEGWTSEAIGRACGLTVHVVRAMGRTPHADHLDQTGEKTYRKLLLGAQKLEALDPVRDGGVSQKVSRSTRSRARGRKSPPIGCWDFDTVHKPETIPEWTGACGTQLGLSVHKREKIPLCRACLELKYVQQKALRERRKREQVSED